MLIIYNITLCVQCYVCRGINVENDEPNNIKNQLTGEWGATPDTARAYKVRIEMSGCTLLDKGVNLKSAKFLQIHLEMKWVDL